MSLAAQIEVLESLAALDAELRVLTDQLSEEQKTLDDKKTQARALEERLEDGQRSVEEMERMRSDLTGVLRSFRILLFYLLSINVVIVISS